jgi:hypothetical protein
METTFGPAPVAESREVCFVISPIGEPGSEARKRSDALLRRIVEGLSELRTEFQVAVADVRSCDRSPGLVGTGGTIYWSDVLQSRLASDLFCEQPLRLSAEEKSLAEGTRRFREALRRLREEDESREKMERKESGKP